MYKVTAGVKKKRLQKKIRKIVFFYFLPFLFLSSIFILLFNNNALQIQQIKFNNEKFIFINKNEVQQKVWSYLDGYYFSILSKKNHFIFFESNLKNILKSEFSEIESVDMELEGNILKINIQEEKPKFIYCIDLEKKECYFLNKKGKIFSKYFDLNLSKKDYLYLYSSEQKHLREYFFPEQNNLEKVQEFIVKLDEKYNLKIQGVHEEEGLFYKFITKNNEKILVSHDFTVKDIFSKIHKATRISDLKIENGKFIKKIDYINLFLQERIVYCIKGDVCEGGYE